MKYREEYTTMELFQMAGRGIFPPVGPSKYIKKRVKKAPSDKKTKRKSVQKVQRRNRR